MIQYNSLCVKLSNPQINTLKSGIKNRTAVTLIFHQIGSVILIMELIFPQIIIVISLLLLLFVKLFQMVHQLI